MIIGDEVDLCVKLLGPSSQGLDLIIPIVDPLDQNVFESDHLALGPDITFTGLHECRERILAIDRHDSRPHLVGRSMKGNGQTVLMRLTGKLLDLWGQATGRKGNFPGSDVTSPWSINDVQGFHEVVVVRHRLSHPHDDQVVHLTILAL